MQTKVTLRVPTAYSTVNTFCRTAKRGLFGCYSAQAASLPYTNRPTRDGRLGLKGTSIRYAAISQIGISRWLRHHPDEGARLPDLRQKISDRIDAINDIGDAALWVWAACESGADNAGQFAGRLVRLWESQSKGCNAVELAWVLKACAMVHESCPDHRAKIEVMMKGADTRLRRLFSPKAGLFRRHAREGWVERIGGRIACFADQVYPIVAYSHYGVLFDDKQALDMAGSAVETICRLQGPLGQWWWHYDTVTGQVCEGYPVFSVHQHSMAPMAIMACDRATGQDHSRAIELGLRWIPGSNELGEDLVHEEAGLIWRDIERREPLKLTRVLRAAFCTAGLRSLHRLAGTCCMGFRVNRECRPYELGWILYAWADHDLQK